MQYKVKNMLLKYIGIMTLLIIQVGLFVLLWFYYYVPLVREIGHGFYYWGYWAVCGLYLLFVVFFTKNLDGYRADFRRARRTALGHIIAMICANAVGVIQIWIVGRHYFNVLPMVFLTLIQCIFIALWAYVMKKIYVSINKRQKLLIIHGDYSPESFLIKDNHIQKMYTIKEVLDLSSGIENDEYINRAIDENEVILLYDVSSETRNSILKYCYANKKNVILTPKISDIIIIGAEELRFVDKPMLMTQTSGLKAEELFMKRLLDIILSLLAIIISLPFMLIISAIIKLQDGGKVIYKQERLTIDEKPFQILKFRSMRENSERDGAQLAKQNDNRITSVGRFLRATHLDELPQFFNILKGDMSFVGPRPERSEIADEYKKLIPEFRYRNSVKAGLTGYAQIYGKYNTTPYDKLKLDLIYIENYSCWLDLKLLLMTLKIVFQRDNTEGVDDNQKTAL